MGGGIESFCSIIDWFRGQLDCSSVGGLRFLFKPGGVSWMLNCLLCKRSMETGLLCLVSVAVLQVSRALAPNQTSIAKQ